MAVSQNHNQNHNRFRAATFRRGPFGASALVAALLLGSTPFCAHSATIVSWIGADGAWEDGANWQTNDGVPQHRPPKAGEWGAIYNGGTARITASTGRVPGSGALDQLRIIGNNGVVVQSGSTVNVDQVWVGSVGGGTYQLNNGDLILTTGVGQLDISSININNQLGRFIQNGGTVDALSIRMKYKGAGESYYELHDGGLAVEMDVRMGWDFGGTATIWFTQTGGTASIGGQILMGLKAGNGTDGGSTIVSLQGGEMTIHGATPFQFAQPGGPVYVDIDGGTLILRGTWDFASLTAIADSDFRVSGAPATAANLSFRPVTIDEQAYTAVAVNSGSLLIVR